MTPTFPEHILLENNTTLPWKEYCAQLASEANLKYKAQKANATPELVEALAAICVTDAELSDESPAFHFQIVEEVCIAIERTNNLERDLNTMSEQPDNRTETPLESPETPEEGKDTTLEVVEPPTGSLENNYSQEIVEAALNCTLENGGYAKLSERFDLGEGMCNVTVKGELSPTAVEWASLLGFGANLGVKSIWITMAAAQGLLALGRRDEMEQICASLKLAPSTIYNYIRTLPYVTEEARRLLPPTVLVEICAARLAGDDESNDKAKKELVAEAVENGWSVDEARSHVKMKKGHDVPITGGGRPKGYRYLLVLPNTVPLFCREEPAWSEGAQVYDFKTQSYLVDDGKKVDWQPAEKS